MASKADVAGRPQANEWYIVCGARRPIAAGIAAVVLDCARGFLSGQEWKSLCRVRSMRRMFEAMKDSGNSDGYWWIKHWTLFHEDRKDSWIQEEIRSYIR